MENASQALIIAGAILLAILIIAIGMYLYNSASATITDSLTNMSTQEIEAYNNQFESYKGKQTGSQISSLCGRLIANANTYKDETDKVPTVVCTQITQSGTGIEDATYTEVGDTNLQDYLDKLATIKNRIENKHAYYVDLSFDRTGLIGTVTINYNDPPTANP